MPADNVIPLRPGDGPVLPGGTGLASRRAHPATYVVLVSLVDSEPPIWRRLELDSRLDLRAVHRILQAGMGWTDSHANLPQGDTAEERMAGALWLLTLRPGRSTYGLCDRHAPVLFDMIAWQSGDRGPTDRRVHLWHLPTLWLLLVLQQDHTTLGARPEQVAAAWDALRGVRPAGA